MKNKPVSNKRDFRGIFFATSKFSLVFKEHPLTPTYKSKSRIYLRSDSVPSNEWTTPPGNLCLCLIRTPLELKLLKLNAITEEISACFPIV